MNYDMKKKLFAEKKDGQFESVEGGQFDQSLQFIFQSIKTILGSFC